MDNDTFAYRASLEAARKALLDRDYTKYETPDAKEQLAKQTEGLMRPRPRPTEVENEEGLGLRLMRAMAEESFDTDVTTSAPETSVRPKARREKGAVTSSPRPNHRPAQELYDGLVARGMAPHVASGFVMNFRDESGFDAGINEANPLVKGSRGGFGLYQLTGPRRVEYEAYAEKTGRTTGSVDAQLDFLMLELDGKESSAARKINATSTAGEAASAIVNHFLRPSKEHRVRRSNRYLRF